MQLEPVTQHNSGFFGINPLSKPQHELASSKAAWCNSSIFMTEDITNHFYKVRSLTSAITAYSLCITEGDLDRNNILQPGDKFKMDKEHMKAAYRV